MGFFNDMNEDFDEEMGEVKPIVPSKEVKNDKVEEIKEDDDFSTDDLTEEDMKEILGEDEFIPEQEEPSDVEKVASVIDKVKKVEKVQEPVVTKEKPPVVIENNTSNEKGTIISSDAIIEGNVTTSSSVVVRGELRGSLKAQDIFVESNGKVTNGIEGKRVVVSGFVNGSIIGEDISIENSKINGDLIGEKRVVVKEKAVVIGNVSSESLEVYGRIKGDLSCKGIVNLKTGSVVKGNITAMEVLIDKGANFQGSIIKTGEIDDSLFE